MPDVHRNPILGSDLTLDCVPPESIPVPEVFWAVRRPGGGFDPLNLDARVTMDIERKHLFHFERMTMTHGMLAKINLNSLMSL